MNTHQKPVSTRETRVLTLKEALAQGATSGFLLTVANSLERLAKSHESEANNLDPSTFENREVRRGLREQAAENWINAASLRRVARDLRNALAIRREKSAKTPLEEGESMSMRLR